MSALSSGVDSVFRQILFRVLVGCVDIDRILMSCSVLISTALSCYEIIEDQRKISRSVIDL